MVRRLQAIAFDLDPASLRSLREALPDWGIEVVDGASTSSFSGEWNPGASDLLIVMARQDAAETLELCRLLACSGDLSIDRRQLAPEPRAADKSGRRTPERPGATLVVLVAPQDDALKTDALQAGVDT